MAASLRVALLVDTSTGYSTQLIHGVAQYAREHGRWQLLIEPRGSRERRLLPRHWRPDGVIARVTHRALARDLARLDVPVVNVSRSVVAGFDFPQVVIDERTVGRWAAEHLLERGFRQFGYCGQTGQAYYTDTCGPAFGARLAVAGFRASLFRPLSRGGAARPSAHLPEQKRWLESLPTPCGVLAAGIEDAFALNEACRECGLRVPEDVAIVCGEDDALLTAIVDPPLSCVDPDSQRVGYEAAALLDRLSAGAKTPRRPRRILPQRIVARRSTDGSAIADPDVAQAVRIIRARAAGGLGMRDVLEAVPLSRRTLEQRFKRAVGRTPAAEIRRVRLARAEELLATTDWSIPRIAQGAGFSQAEVMNQVFRRELHCTPSEHRRRSRTGGTATVV